jgi:hypothetical protein
MLRALPQRVAMLAAAAALLACVSTTGVPLRDGAFPRGAVQVGEDVRVTTRAGAALAFEVAGVDDGVLTGVAGERVEAGDLASLEVKRFNKRATIIAASVIGGVIGTALVIEEAHDDGYCTIFRDDCELGGP